MASLSTKIKKNKKKELGSVPASLSFLPKKAKHRIPSTITRKINPKGKNLFDTQVKQARALSRLGLGITKKGTPKKDWDWWQIPLGLNVDSKDPKIDGTLFGRDTPKILYPFVVIALPFQAIMGTIDYVKKQWLYGLTNSVNDDYKGESGVRVALALIGLKPLYESAKSLLDGLGAIDAKNSLLRDEYLKKGEFPVLNYLTSDYRTAGIIYAVGSEAWDNDIRKYNKWFDDLPFAGKMGVIGADIAFSVAVSAAGLGASMSLKTWYNTAKLGIQKAGKITGATTLTNAIKNPIKKGVINKLANTKIFIEKIQERAQSIYKNFSQNINRMEFLTKGKKNLFNPKVYKLIKSKTTGLIKGSAGEKEYKLFNKIYNENPFLWDFINRKYKHGLDYGSQFFKRKKLSEKELKRFYSELFDFAKKNKKLNEFIDVDWLAKETATPASLWDENFINTVMNSMNKEGFVSNFLYNSLVTQRKMSDFNKLVRHKIKSIFWWLPDEQSKLKADVNAIDGSHYVAQTMKAEIVEYTAKTYLEIKKTVVGALEEILKNDSSKKILTQAIKSKDIKQIAKMLKISSKSTKKFLESANINTLKELNSILSRNKKWNKFTTKATIDKEVSNFINNRFEFAKIQNYHVQQSLIESLKETKRLILPFSKNNEAYVEALSAILKKKFSGTSFETVISLDPIGFAEKGANIGAQTAKKLSNVKDLLTKTTKKTKVISLHIYQKKGKETTKFLSKSESEALINTALSSFDVDELMSLTSFGQFVNPLANKKLVFQGLKDVFEVSPQLLQGKKTFGYSKVIGLFYNLDRPMNKEIAKSVFNAWKKILPKKDKHIMAMLDSVLRGRYNMNDVNSLVGFFQDIIMRSSRRDKGKLLTKLAETMSAEIKKLADDFAKGTKKTFFGSFSKRIRKKILNAYDNTVPIKLRNKIISDGYIDKNAADFVVQSQVLQELLTPEGLRPFINLPDFMKNRGFYYHIIKDEHSYEYLRLLKWYEQARSIPKNYSHFKEFLPEQKLIKEQYDWLTSNQNPIFQKTKKSFFKSDMNYWTPQEVNSIYDADIVMTNPVELMNFKSSEGLESLKNARMVESIFSQPDVKLIDEVMETKKIISDRGVPISGQSKGVSGVLPNGKVIIDYSHPDIKQIFSNYSSYKDINFSYGNVEKETVSRVVKNISEPLRNDVFSKIYTKFKPDDAKFIYNGYHAQNVLRSINNGNMKQTVANLDEMLNSYISHSKSYRTYSAMKELTPAQRTLKFKNNPVLKNLYKEGQVLETDEVYKALTNLRNRTKNHMSNKNFEGFVKDSKLYNKLLKEIENGGRNVGNQFNKRISKNTKIIKAKETMTKNTDEINMLRKNLKTKTIKGTKETLKAQKKIKMLNDKNTKLEENIYNEEKINQIPLRKIVKEMDGDNNYLQNILKEHTEKYGPQYSPEMINSIKEKLKKGDIFLDDKKITTELQNLMDNTNFKKETMDEMETQLFNFTNNGKKPYIEMPAPVFNLIKRVPSIKERGTFERMINYLTDNFFMKMWKGTALLSVGYHGRNIVSNIHQSYMAGVPLHYASSGVTKNAFNLIRAKAKFKKLTNTLISELGEAVKINSDEALSKIAKKYGSKELLKNKVLKEFLKLNQGGLFSGDHYLSMTLKSMFDDLSKLNRVVAGGVTANTKILTDTKNLVSKIFEKNMGLGKLLDHAQKMTTYQYIKSQSSKIFSLKNNKILFNRNIGSNYLINGNISDWNNIVGGLNRKIVNYSQKTVQYKKTLEQTDNWLKQILTKKRSPELKSWMNKNSYTKESALRNLKQKKLFFEEELANMKTKSVGRYAKDILEEAQHSFSLRASINAHFNYSELSGFERRYAKKIIPFYVWARKAFEYNLKAAWKQTNRVHIADRTYNVVSKAIIGELADETEADPVHGIRGKTTRSFSSKNDLIPDWLLRDGKTPLYRKDGLIYYVKTELPHLTIQRLMGFGSFNMFASVNPVFKLGIESLYGVNLYSGRKDDSSFQEKALNTLLFKGRVEKLFKTEGKNAIQHGLEASGLVGSYDIQKQLLSKKKQRIYENQKLINAYRKKGNKIKYSL